VKVENPSDQPVPFEATFVNDSQDFYLLSHNETYSTTSSPVKLSSLQFEVQAQSSVEMFLMFAPSSYTESRTGHLEVFSLMSGKMHYEVKVSFSSKVTVLQKI
jgi:hypothetical protein